MVSTYGWSCGLSLQHMHQSFSCVPSGQPHKAAIQPLCTKEDAKWAPRFGFCHSWCSVGYYAWGQPAYSVHLRRVHHEADALYEGLPNARTPIRHPRRIQDLGEVKSCLLFFFFLMNPWFPQDVAQHPCSIIMIMYQYLTQVCHWVLS